MPSARSPFPSRMKALATITLGAICGLLPFAHAGELADPRPQPVVAIENVGVVDVVSGEVSEPRTVLIASGLIAAIDKPEKVTIPPAALRVDGAGRYLIPGLVDMHVHLFNNASHRPPNDWAFPLFVANGITGVREMRTEPGELPLVNRWRREAENGQLIAPRVLAAGVAVGAGPLDATRRKVREAKAAGADFIKIFSEVPEPNWRAILAEANAQHLPVCGHIPAEVSVLDAARAGQRTDEHLTQVYEACSPREKELLATRKGREGGEIVRLRDAQEREVLGSYDQVLCDRTAAALAKTGQVQVPTLVLPYFEAHGSRTNFRDDPRWRYLRVDERTRWERIFQSAPVEDGKLAAPRWEVSRQIVKTLRAAGVRILAGTDTPMPLNYPGFALHEELALLVMSGLTPAEALRAATIRPAEFLGLSESTGTVAVGKRADLVLLDANPLRDIRNTKRIRAVILGGRLLPRPSLDQLLATAATSQTR